MGMSARQEKAMEIVEAGLKREREQAALEASAQAWAAWEAVYDDGTDMAEEREAWKAAIAAEDAVWEAMGAA